MLTKADEGEGGVSQMLTIADGGGRGVHEPLILADVICEQPLMELHVCLDPPSKCIFIFQSPSPLIIQLLTHFPLFLSFPAQVCLQYHWGSPAPVPDKNLYRQKQYIGWNLFLFEYLLLSFSWDNHLITSLSLCFSSSWSALSFSASSAWVITSHVYSPYTIIVVIFSIVVIHKFSIIIFFPHYF